MRTFAGFIAMISIVLALSACNITLDSSPVNNAPVVIVEDLPALKLGVETQNGSTEYRNAGEVILYKYAVTNTGNTSLLGPVTITDRLGTVNCPALSMVGNLDDYFDPTETLLCSGSYTITPQDFNNGSVTIQGTIAVGGEISNVTSITLNRAVETQSVVPLSITQALAVTPTTTYTPSNYSISPDPSTPVPTLNAFDQEETAIKNQPSASYQYIAPVSLKVDETFVVELYMSRSMGPEQLSTQMFTDNELVTSTAEPERLYAPGGAEVMLEGGQVEVTQWMQAKLFSEDPDAFEIRPLHDKAVQFLDANTTVKWQWIIKAKKAGVYNLIFAIYQQAITNDISNWHTLEAERRVVEVNVTLGQQIRSLDWQWIVVVLVALAVILVSLVWYARRKSNLEEDARTRQAAIGSYQSFPSSSPLARLPRAANVEISGREIIGNVFISYRRSDSADITGRIYDRLVGVFGRKPVFKDVDSIPLGTDFKEYLDQQVSGCNVLLAIIGDRWVDARGLGGKRRLDDPDDFVRLEIESALERGIPVIPLLVRGAHMPEEEELPPSLRKLVYKNGIPIRPDPDFHNDMDRLISALEKYIRTLG